MLKNEKGAVLLTVFFILILFTILGLSIMGVTLQSSKVRTFANDEIEGKMLAEIGLLYLKENLEKELSLNEDDFEKGTNPIIQSIKSPTSTDSIIEIINTIAAQNSSTKIENYLYTSLPGKGGGFAIGYYTGGTIKYKNGTGEPSQPYSRRIDVSIIGLPAGSTAAQADGTVTINNDKQSLSKIEATFYINTVPGPFHYAISTPGEIRFFGGSNIIGNVMANNIISSQAYRYKVDDAWSKEDGGKANQTYIEGKLFLTQENESGVYMTDAYPTANPPEEDDLKHYIEINKDTRITTKAGLKANNIFMPKGKITDDRTELNAPKPFLPGWEPPLVEMMEDKEAENFSLFDDPEEKIGWTEQEEDKEKRFFNKKVKERKETTDPLAVNPPPVGEETTLSFEQGENAENDEDKVPGFTKINAGIKQRILIESTQPKPKNLEEAPSLTVRLTGTSLYERNVSELFIIPQDPKEHKVTVEMGRKGQFSDPPTEDGEPFTYKGTIYIQGDLDIVNDIDITGTIYVDGNVTIREASNDYRKKPARDGETNEETEAEAKNKSNNLAIIASGQITLTNRYTEDKYQTDPLTQWLAPKDDDFIENKVPALSAFLYSDYSFEDLNDLPIIKGMEIYSVKSINHIRGGIGASEGYIELNTKRGIDSDPFPSRLSIQYNRGVFEQETPGLPAGTTFFIDVYDTTYTKQLKNDIKVISKK
jgi:hypothetical protein